MASKRPFHVYPHQSNIDNHRRGLGIANARHFGSLDTAVRYAAAQAPLSSSGLWGVRRVDSAERWTVAPDGSVTEHFAHGLPVKEA